MGVIQRTRRRLLRHRTTTSWRVIVLRPHSVRPLAAVATVATLAGVATVGTTALALTGPAGVAGAASTPSAQTKYLAAINAVGDQGVHFASSAKQGGVTFSVNGDTGTSSGVQTLTLKKGSLIEHITVMQVGSTGYLDGNATALHNVVDLTTAQAKKDAGTWLSFSTTSGEYADLVTGLLNSQISTELKMSGPFTYGKAATINGTDATAIVGKVDDDSGGTIAATLYVAASGTPLPLKQVTNPGAKSDTVSGSVTFTHWGEQVAEGAGAFRPAPATSTATSGTSSGS